MLGVSYSSMDMLPLLLRVIVFTQYLRIIQLVKYQITTLRIMIIIVIVIIFMVIIILVIIIIAIIIVVVVVIIMVINDDLPSP